MVAAGAGVLPAYGADISGHFKLASEEGRGFYRVEAFDGPEFVTVLKPTTNVFGSAGLPDKVQERNSRRKSLGTFLIFSRMPPSPKSEFSGNLYEVNCSIPGVPSTFYVASADLRQGILMDPTGFFYPQVGQNVRAFKASGGTMLPASASSVETSAGQVVGVGPSSLLAIRRDGSISAREIPFDAVAADESMFRSVSQLDPFFAEYCSYLARTSAPPAPSKTPEILSSMGSNLPRDSDNGKVFRRAGMSPLAVVETETLVAVASSGENSPVDRIVVIAKESETLPPGDIAGVLAALADGAGWKAADTAGRSPAWEHNGAGLRVSLNDRRNILICRKAP